MILTYVNPATVALQIAAQKPDGTPKLDVASGTVRVYSLNAAGAEVVALAPTALVGASSIWRYVWQPASLAEGQYLVEYTLTDGVPLSNITVEDLDVRAATDVGAALSSYGAATATNVTSAVAAICGDEGDTLETLSGQIDLVYADTDALDTRVPSDPADQSAVEAAITAAVTATRAGVTTDHGAGAYNGVATGQAVRDALALALTPGTTVASESVDSYLLRIESRAEAGGVFGTAYSSADSKVYVGDVTDLYFDCVATLTGATVLRIDVVKPSGAATSWTGTLYGTHEILYTTSASDLATAGEYACTPYYEKGGKKIHRPTVWITVYAVGT